MAVLPIGTLIYVDPARRGIDDLALASGVVTHLLTFVAACLLWFHWRMSTSTTAGWLTGAMTAITVQGLVGDVSWLGGGSTGSSGVAAMLVSQVLLVGALAAMYALTQRHHTSHHTSHRATRDPVLSGLVAGVAVSAAHLALLRVLPPAGLDGAQLAWLAVLTWATYGLLAVVVALDSPDPLWVRARVATALVVLGAATAGPWPGSTGPELAGRSVLALVAGILLCSTALRLLGHSIVEHHTAVDDLTARLALIEGGVRHERAARHEIRATIAGIASASRLVHHGVGVSAHRRQLLERMLDLEMTRLQRLVDDDRGESGVVDLDQVLAPVVVRQQLAGREIEWSPTGRHIHARPDAVAEVVSILLENAAQHAASSIVVVQVRAVGSQVEIAVSDSGPGVDAEVSDALFDWGRRGPGSRGEGIGLAAARRLMVEQHGELRHVAGTAVGATFVATLPAADPADGPDPADITADLALGLDRGTVDADATPRAPFLVPALGSAAATCASEGGAARATAGHVA